MSDLVAKPIVVAQSVGFAKRSTHPSLLAMIRTSETLH
jgi:hypothetical protein